MGANVLLLIVIVPFGTVKVMEVNTIYKLLNNSKYIVNIDSHKSQYKKISCSNDNI